MIQPARIEQIKDLLCSDDQPEDLAKKLYAFGISDNPDRPDTPLNGDELEQLSLLCDAQNYREKAALIGAIQKQMQNNSVPVVGISDLPPIRPPEQTGFKMCAKKTRLHAHKMSEVTPKPAEWLVQNYIPAKSIVIMAADGGTGKTYIWCNLVAAITSGTDSLFDEAIGNPYTKGKSQKVGNALIFSAEDEESCVLYPRLEAAGANMDRVSFIPIEDEQFKELDFGGEGLKQLIEDNHPRVVIFDPLQAFLPSGVNMSQRNQMRACLAPLIRLARTYDTTFLLVMHTRKGKNVYGRDRIADSSDIFDIARAAFIVGQADKAGTVYISHEKSSYSKLQPTILTRVVGFSNNLEDVGKAVFCGTSGLRDEDYMKQAMMERPAPKFEAASEFIVETLSDGKEHYANEVMNLAMANGITAKTYTAAKAKLKTNGVIAYHPASFRGKSVMFKVQK